jgi:hypothetical protein
MQGREGRSIGCAEAWVSSHWPLAHLSSSPRLREHLGGNPESDSERGCLLRRQRTRVRTSTASGIISANKPTLSGDASEGRRRSYRPSQAGRSAMPPILAHPAKARLAERRISVRALARALGRNEQHVSRVLNGHVPPSDDFRREVAALLELPEVGLFHEDPRKGTRSPRFPGDRSLERVR